MIILRDGNLFNCPHNYSMAHCISADAKMSKGIALHFIDQFPEIASLRKTTNLVGTAVAVNVGGRTVYNLVTKQRFWMKPSLQSIRDCLLSMLSHALANGINDICIPKLGSGCDKLDFNNDVMPLLKCVFGDQVINIHVYCYRYVISVSALLLCKVVEFVL